MKNLILITAFCPDSKRQEILRKLVYNIEKDNFDILLVSHSLIPADILDKVNYFVFDKNNILDYDLDKKFSFYFSNQEFVVKTTEPKKYNHFVACIRLITTGLAYAKNLGYKIVHYFEYDSLITNFDELLENSQILENHSAVYYDLPILGYPNSPMSFHLDKISKKWFDVSLENFYEFLLRPNSTKIIEQYQWELLIDSNSLYKKNKSDLETKGIEVGTYYDLELNNWIVPVYDSRTDKICIFSRVEDDKEEGSIVIVIVNEEKIFKLIRGKKFQWTIINLGKVDEINKIQIIVNDEVRRSYDFNTISIEDFKKTNHFIWRQQ